MADEQAPADQAPADMISEPEPEQTDNSAEPDAIELPQEPGSVYEVKA